MTSHPPVMERDVPRLGIIRPPLVFLATILLGLLLHWAAPRPLLPRPLAVPLGVSLVILAVALFVSAVGKFKAAGTPVPAREPTTAIVRSGPFRLSRNPIYLAFAAPARDRDLGQRPVDPGHPDCRGGADPLQRDPQRGGVPGAAIREPVPGLQGLGSPLALGYYGRWPIGIWAPAEPSLALTRAPE